jgi:ATP-dependent Lon protease
MIAAIRVDDPGKLSDMVGANLPLTIEEKQDLLEVFDPIDRLTRVAEMLDIEIEKLNVDRTIQGRVKRQMEKAQKEYYLNEKIKAIQKELGRGEKSESDELKKKIETSGMSKDALDKAMAELKRLENMPPMSAESTVSRNYLDWLLAVPWKKKSKEIRDLKFAEKVLESDHYGLEKIKERILEFLAVRRLVKNPKGSILCFVGPPGVGKTSLGMSIAAATGRKFVRLSLGGVRDEAEVRGHRRTYIGALPGQIIQSIRRAETNDPVMMLDEVDKLGRDFRGDPASALLETLDPEQNNTFRDNYLDVPFDLSKVLFICTANMLDTVPPPLIDRMEIIPLQGYSEEEKVHIANQYLIPRQIKENGITAEQIEFPEDAVRYIIRHYTREAGVRKLEQTIGTVCRKQARRVVEGHTEKLAVTRDTLKEFLGGIQVRVETEVAERVKRPGVAVGLAWTPAGGDILFIEANKMKGKGGFTMTGQIGEVMQESMQAALTWVRSNAARLGLAEDFTKEMDLHIHVPAGAIPKDGPSAGVTMATVLASLLTDTPVRPLTAMTGEITLSGNVLPVGGIKEKFLAARRAGVENIILPAENRQNVEEDLTPEMMEGVTVHYAGEIEDVLAVALPQLAARPQLRPSPVEVTASAAA